MFQLPPIPTYDQCMDEFSAERVTARVSNDGHYRIFNYNQQTSIAKLWNDVNQWCRGLIFDEHTHEIVAVPFFKFFNLNQRPETSLESVVREGAPVRIANKEDGSLGIIFWDKYRSALRVSTRGSLDSEQAEWATAWINRPLERDGLIEVIRFMSHAIDRHYTYQCEVIYTKNRIVLDYGDFEGLVGLARVCNVTGLPDYDLTVLPAQWPRTLTFDDLDIPKILSLRESLTWQQEGWVITYPSGLMVKVKVKDYERVHAIRFSVTPNTILKIMQDGCDPLMAIEDLPDEFIDDIKSTMLRIEAVYAGLLEEFHASCDLGLSMAATRSRKESALWCLSEVNERFRSSFFYVISGRGAEPRQILMNMIKYEDIS